MAAEKGPKQNQNRQSGESVINCIKTSSRADEHKHVQAVVDRLTAEQILIQLLEQSKRQSETQVKRKG